MCLCVSCKLLCDVEWCVFVCEFVCAWLGLCLVCEWLCDGVWCVVVCVVVFEWFV